MNLMSMPPERSLSFYGASERWRGSLALTVAEIEAADGVAYFFNRSAASLKVV